MEVYDVAIVGAGPIGIACGVNAKRSGLSHVIFEKGCLTNAVYRFPPQLVFFSTAELLEVGDVPFLTSGPKPTRSDILNYYRRVTQHYDLDVRFAEEVLELEHFDDDLPFVVRSSKGEYRARHVVLCTGFYDHPNLLGIPGEDLPKVSHFYTEPFPFFRRKVAVIGGQNSAVEAALELYRHGAEATLIHRRERLGRAIKYWVLPDIENRIKEGSVRAFFESKVVEIREDAITVEGPDGKRFDLENDFVFAMTGYSADLAFLERAGITLEGEKKRPIHDPETMETNVDRLYIAGVVTGGMNTNRIFIENGREHARRIARHIVARSAEGAPSAS